MWPFPLSAGLLGTCASRTKKRDSGKKYCQGVLKPERNDFQLFYCVFDAMERLKKAGNVGFIFGILLLHTSTSGKPFFCHGGWLPTQCGGGEKRRRGPWIRRLMFATDTINHSLQWRGKRNCVIVCCEKMLFSPAWLWKTKASQEHTFGKGCVLQNFSFAG